MPSYISAANIVTLQFYASHVYFSFVSFCLCASVEGGGGGGCVCVCIYLVHVLQCIVC